MCIFHYVKRATDIAKFFQFFEFVESILPLLDSCISGDSERNTDVGGGRSGA